MQAEDRAGLIRRVREHRRQRLQAATDRANAVGRGLAPAPRPDARTEDLAPRRTLRQEVLDFAIDEDGAYPGGQPGHLTRRTGHEPAEFGGPGTSVDAIALLRGGRG